MVRGGGMHSFRPALLYQQAISMLIEYNVSLMPVDFKRIQSESGFEVPKSCYLKPKVVGPMLDVTLLIWT